MDFNEVEFEEYNPHPYQGGYDIALTYGRPLPQSSAICYPISASPSSPPSELPPPPSHGEERHDPAGQQGEADLQTTREAGEPARGSDSAGEDLWRGYGTAEFPGSEGGYRGGDTEPYPGLFGYWPFSAREFEGSNGGRDYGGWDFLNCAADYLFGYLHVYGEKRDESHNYGNLNYAYERHHRQEPLLIQFNPHEPSWCEQPRYHEDHQEEVYTHSGYGFSYGGDTSEVPHTEIVCAGASWSPMSYREDYSGQVYPQSERSHAYERHNHEDYAGQGYPQSGCSYAYERHYYEQPVSIQCEHIEHTWSQKLSFSEFHENNVHPQRAVDGSELPEQPLDMFDFIKQSWYEMLNNNESGEVMSYPQLNMHNDPRNKSEQQSDFPLYQYSGYDD